MKKKKPAPSLWVTLFGSLACLSAFLLPLFPDEKLVRLKLEVFELSIFVLLVLTGIFFILQRRWEDAKEGRAFLIALHVWLVANTVLFLFSQESSLAVMEMRRVVLAYGAFLVFRFGPFDETWRDRFVLSWAVASSLLCVYGLLQWNGGLGPVRVPQVTRIFGTFGNPIFFAAYLLVGFYFTRHAIQRYKDETWSILLLGGLALHAIALYLAKTRASWIALGLLILIETFFHFQSKKKAILFSVSLIGLGLLFIILTQDIWKRDQGHLLIWRDTLRMAFQHPLLGVGLGAFHVRFPDFAQADLISKWPKGEFIVNYAHNEYVQMFSEGGLLLLLAFIGLLGTASWMIWKNKDQLHSRQFFLLAGAALLIQNFFSVDMRFSFSFAFLFLCLGLVMRPAVIPVEAGIHPPSLNLPAGQAGLRRTRYILIILWAAFMFGLLLPLLLKPYLAHRTFSKQVGFFDERVIDPTKTADEIQELINKYPDEPALLERLAYLYAKEMKDTKGKINQEMSQKALVTYKKLIDISPDNVGAYNNTANILYTLGDVDGAISNWKKAVKINPDFLDVHLNLGKIHYVRGELKESAYHLQEVLKRKPNNAEAQIYLKKMVE